MSLTFCGASVRGFSSNIGWNEQQSGLRVSVVEDPSQGDFFNPPTVGTPIYFQFEAFKFFGLIQKWVRDNSTDGLPTYTIECIDPRQILEGAQIITGAYRGPVTINNLFNAFGWWENLTGFGSSLSNDAGMPYYKVAEAVTTMANSLTGSYGTALKFMGVTYSLDLSELPVPPAYYRIPGPSIGLLELISMVCEDGGCDYFIELELFTIKVRTVSRANAAQLGVVGQLQGAGWGVDLMRSSAGLESRNEITSAFVIGGEQKILHMTLGEAIQPFWGFDIEGLPILGTGIGVAHTADLNASPVADIVGSTSYTCTVFEMCCALGGMETWMTFIETFKPDLFTALKLPSIIGKLFANPRFANDILKDDILHMTAINDAFALDINALNSRRLYEYVNGFATDYMGKKFVVAIPFTLTATEPETLKPLFSQEPTDGAYLPEGAEPLGLPALVEDQFKDTEGKFEAFCLFNNLTNVDLTRVSGQDNGLFLGEKGIYLKVNVDEKPIFTPAPAVIVTISNPIYEMPTEPLGDLTLVAQVFGVDPDIIANRFNNIAGGAAGDFAIRPPAHQPDFIAIPLKSNILTYGPWYLQGAPGKVKFEYDSSLTPWQFGGYELMNLAGEAKVTQSITNMQAVETGTLEFAGPPIFALGDLLQGNGPNITGIDVSYGDRGITTIYRMTTFTPKFGSGNFNKDTAKRLERMGRINAQLRRDLRANINKVIDTNEVLTASIAGAINRLPPRIKRESPHTTFISNIVDDPALSGGSRVSTSSGTLQEVIGGCGGTDSAMWKKTAIMSLTGLLRPFSTNVSDTNMSHLVTPSANFSLGINKDYYNPLAAGHDINELAWGSSYAGVATYGASPSTTDTRGMALRGPLMVSGWGWTIDNKFVPGDSGGNPGTAYVSNTLKKSHLWKTGPVDLLWDDKRGVWTSHDILIGKTNSAISGFGSGTLKVWNGSVDTGWTIPIYNWFGGGVSGDITVICGYCVTANRWYVLAADCNS